MPRDIDYNLKAKTQSVKRRLNRQNAIVDAIRTGNVTKAEILSDTELVPRDPIYEGLLEKQKKGEIVKDKGRTDREKEILNQLRVIAEKPGFDYNKFARAFKRMLDTEETQREALEAPLPEVADDEEESLIEEPEDEYDLEFPDTLPVKVKIGDNEYVTYPMYTKEQIDATTDEKIISDYLQAGLQDNDAYFKRLNLGKRGQHLIKHQEAHQKNYENYTKYLAYINQRLRQLQTGSSIMTSLSDLKEKLQLLVGSIESGNTSKELKNELADILHYLYKNRKINKTTYKTFMNLTV